MGNQQRMSDNPRLSAAISFSTLGAVAGSTRGKEAGTVAQNRTAPRLIECDPKLHSGAESLEAHSCIVFEVLDELFLIQHATVSLVQIVGQVPVEQGDHGLDAGSM